MGDDDRRRIQRFRESFNRVEATILKGLGKPGAKLKPCITEYAKRNPQWPDHARLLGLADIRNVLAHSDGLAERMAVPTPEALLAIKAIEERLLSPERVHERFKRRVTTIRPDSSVRVVLELVHKHDYSQFPIIEGRQVTGLLTENGLARWLAAHVKRQTSMLDLEHTVASTVLEVQAGAENHRFVGPKATLEEVVWMFAENPTLEAVLVTPKATPLTPLIGIATRWDILEVKGSGNGQRLRV